MGASQSGSNVLAGCTPSVPGAAARTANGGLVISIVRSSTWGMGGEDDVWQVEVPAAASVKDLKAKIEELYEVPMRMQKLAKSSNPSEPSLEDTILVETLAKQKIYLLPAPIGDVLGLGDMGAMGLAGPAPEAQAALAGLAESFMGAMHESMETAKAMQDSLQGVTYKVTFERPVEAGGKAAGKRVALSLDALALVSDVQQMVEVELFGAGNSEPAFLIFEGKPLPPVIPIHAAGIEDGKTVIVSKEKPPELVQAEQLLEGLGMSINPGMGGGFPQMGGAGMDAQQAQQLLQSLMGGAHGNSPGGMDAQQAQQLVQSLMGGTHGSNTGAPHARM